jgi:ADP-heptose:LPS heptosyltransferase
MVELERIRRVLIVKLDHLGDVYLALPAMQKLRALFPRAKLTALVGPWAKSIVETQPFLDEVLTLTFFDVHSASGHKTLTNEERRAIRQRLQPLQFDLAIDLRLEPDTREILRLSGAPVTAGFAHKGDASGLTVAIPWEANLPLHRAMRHASQALTQLVEMLASAGGAVEHPRVLVAPDQQEISDTFMQSLLPSTRSLVIAIHPGSGRPIKCWPTRSFAELADRFSERLGADVVLFGGPKDGPLLDDIRTLSKCRDRVHSARDKLTFPQFVGALSWCDLFVGNDSGPAHLAASTGMPTLVVFSGTNDPRQWAPPGPEALVIYRKMLCSPCYLPNRHDCPFQVACLEKLTVHEVWEAALRALLPKWTLTRRLPN